MLTFSAAIVFGLIQAAVPPQATPPAGQPAAVAAPPQAADPALQLANSPTPTDPQELLDIGQKVNGLDGAGGKPWHLKASYEVFEPEGTSRDKGSFEEWWASYKQIKMTYATQHLALTRYVTDQGAFRIGDASQQTGAESRILELLTGSPFTSAVQVTRTLSVKNRQIGSLALRCLVSDNRHTPRIGTLKMDNEVFCFDVNKPMLRFNATSNSDYEEHVIRDQIVLFRNHYLARQITLTRLGKVYLTIHLDSIESMDSIDPGVMQPPQNAVHLAAGPFQNLDVEPPQILHAVDPLYPPKAVSTNARGIVTVHGLVGTDGRVTEVFALDGPPVFRQAAIEAVAKYVFKPARQAGQPVACEINVEINFRIFTQ